jgi:hypothetical protein
VCEEITWAWRYKPAIPPFRRLRQEDHEFKASLSNMVRSCLQINIFIPRAGDIAMW